MAITIIDNDKRVLLSEGEVDAQYLGKFVLVDIADVEENYDGGYLIAFGDLTEEVEKELFEYGQTLKPKVRPYIMSGIAERGGSLWISRNH
ncbi:MAG: hypothetical protein FWC09_00945 [Lachnospiraceae bacterium]|nr:hypothetical protein [Lachnospiraceae bacterium]